MQQQHKQSVPTTTTNMLINCRILYSTQTGRAKACARRVARIISEIQQVQVHQQQQPYNDDDVGDNDNNMNNEFDMESFSSSSQQQQQQPSIIYQYHFLNGNGNTFDDEIIQNQSLQQQEQQQDFDNQNDNNVTTTTTEPTEPLLRYRKHLQETNTTLLFLFISTTGDGEHTDTIQNTWQLLLHKSLPKKLFDGIKFCIFALGDRAYGHQFCASGRKVATRILQLGGQLHYHCYQNEQQIQLQVYQNPSPSQNQKQQEQQLQDSAPKRCTCAIGYGDDSNGTGGVFYDLDKWLEEQLLPSVSLKQSQQSPLQSHNNQPLVVSSLPPYQISKVVITSTSNLLLLSNAMNEFYQHLCPFTAYAYDDENTTTTTIPVPDTNHKNQNSHHPDNNKNHHHHLRLQRLSVPAKKMIIQSMTNDDTGTSTCTSFCSPLVGTVIENKKMIPNHNNNNENHQDTRHIRIHVQNKKSISIVSNEKLSKTVETTIPTTTPSALTTTLPTTTLPTSSYVPPYCAGDVVSILPRNDVKDVQRFIDLLPPHIQENVDDIIQIDYIRNNNNNKNNNNFYPGVCYHYWPKICTIRIWLQYCANINALPEREDLRALSYCCNCSTTTNSHATTDTIHSSNIQQRDKLVSLSETKYSALYVDYIIREKRTWMDVLYDFDSLRQTNSFLTMEILFALLQPIQPRDYSIASSPTLSTTTTTTTRNQLTTIPFSNVSTTTTAATTTTTPTNVQPGHNDGFYIDLCIGVVHGTTPLGRSYKGLCTNYLANIVEPTSIVTTTTTTTTTDQCSSSSELWQEDPFTIYLWIRPGSFHGLPLDPEQIIQCKKNSTENGEVANTPSTSTSQRLSCHYRFQQPVLYIGAGTGIAPLRGLIHERYATLALHCQTLMNHPTNIDTHIPNDDIHNNNENTTGGSGGGGGDDSSIFQRCDTILLFGCRNQTLDFYYEKEWSQLETDHSSFALLPAFSRDQSHSKTYVQHILQNEIDDDESFLYKFLIEDKGCIYIAGNPNMARAVKEKLIENICDFVEGGESKALQFLMKLQRDGRFAIEAWS